MINLFITVSRYLCILLIVLYTYCNFRVLSMADEEAASELCHWQFRIILLIHFLCSCILYIKTENPASLVFFLARLLFFLLYAALSRRLYRNINRLLLNNICLFLCYGLIMLERLNFEKAAKQFLIVLAASLLSLLIPYLIDRIWNLARWRYLFLGLGLSLLLSVWGVGAVSYGAKMSLSIGGFSLQASELVKISFILSMAGFLSRAESIRELCLISAAAAAHMIILVLCRDLGSALIFFLAYLVMLYLSTGRKIYLFGGSVAAAVAGLLSYRMFSHVRTRVFAWLDPWADIDNKGYQITQSLFAIGTGGYLGLGLYQGLPNKIPIVEKDFIISAISEELGAVTAICLTLICLGCFMQMMLIATYMGEGFYKLAAVGLAIEYITQVFLTIGGAFKFIPSTGVTLPFVSYGGSSILSSFMVFSLIQALYIIQGNEDEEEFTEEEYPEEPSEEEPLREAYPEEIPVEYV